MTIVYRKYIFLTAYIIFFACTPSLSNEAKANVCVAPPQPENGNRKLQKSQCKENCDVQEGVNLPIGSLLVYTCNSGYRMIGSSNIFCSLDGNWSDIPACTEINCKPLASASINAECSFNGLLTSCESHALSGTVAKLNCRNGYREDTRFLFKHRNQVQCNENGQWEPEPLQCFSVCGVITLPVKPLIANGKIADSSMFPWHASLYYQRTPNGTKDYICGATIVTEKFLLTAAHCVYLEIDKKTLDPKRLYVATGNVFRDFDSVMHNLHFKNAKVKNIYINCRYLGDAGNYANDVAIVEIEEPFVFSASLLPACLDNTFIDSGLGLIAGFGLTEKGQISTILQSTSLQYVPFNQCRSSIKSSDSRLITIDKFCAGYNNGTAVCRGDSGGGLVFKTGNLWYLRGIVNVALRRTKQETLGLCDISSYSLFTRISSHLDWIQDVIFRVERSDSVPLCHDSNIIIKTTTTEAPTPPPITTTTMRSYPQITRPLLCAAPPRPVNGNRLLHRSQCQKTENCDVQEGVELPIGSYLEYTCNRGYEISDTRGVFCGLGGIWLNIPFCNKIHCKSLISQSTFAECTLRNEWVPCESAIFPGTIAKLSCRNGYNIESVYLSKQRDQVTCNENGQWIPDPIRCVPVCGHVEEFNSKPFIVNGMTAEFFPWHATLYEVKRFNGPKEFICGATIIKENFLVTSAHCVFDETNNSVNNPRKYYIATGNLFRDYDSEKHDIRYVKKSRVKKIYVHCSYLGNRGNYAWDIALIEIEVPFIFTRWLLPACLDNTFIESGLGVVSGFGNIAPEKPSIRLQFTALPYVSGEQCKSLNKSIVYEQLITFDKFCAGYTNGTSVCDGDSGGGLLFKVGNIWFLRGIVSSGISFIQVAGGTICDIHSYSLYTRISSYFSWIQDIIYNLKPREFACIK